MAQKPLFKKAQKAKGKPSAANRHGKDLKVRKGGLPGKREHLLCLL